MALSKFTKLDFDSDDEKQTSGKQNDVPDVFTPMTLERKFAYMQNITNFENCPDISKYKIGLQIGNGRHGPVHMAHDKADSNLVVVIKKIKLRSVEGTPLNALREIGMLKQIKHENIARLVEVCRSSFFSNGQIKFDYSLVMEYYDYNLAKIIDNQSVEITDVEAKSIMSQLLNATNFMHQQGIVHLDLKSENLFLHKDGQLKVVDVGVERFLYKPKDAPKIEEKCLLLWYRAPELLLGGDPSVTGINMWNMGLVISELWLRSAFLQGCYHTADLKVRLFLFGPNERTSAKFTRRGLRLSAQFKLALNEKLKGKVSDEKGLELLDCFLELEPDKRLTADKALEHEYFRVPPHPTNLLLLIARLKDNRASDEATS